MHVVPAKAKRDRRMDRQMKDKVIPTVNLLIFVVD